MCLCKRSARPRRACASESVLSRSRLWSGRAAAELVEPEQRAEKATDMILRVCKVLNLESTVTSGVVCVSTVERVRRQGERRREPDATERRWAVAGRVAVCVRFRSVPIRREYRSDVQLYGPRSCVSQSSPRVRCRKACVELYLLQLTLVCDVWTRLRSPRLCLR